MKPTPADDGEPLGRYRLLERIGGGGMAEVFKAKSFGVEGFEKLLVIKRIVPELARHDEFVELFVQEAKLAVRLSHANIVQTFDLGRTEARGDDPASYYIAMEFVPGVDLATVLEHHRRNKLSLPLGAVVYVIGEVAKALDHAHSRRDEEGRPLGIVHRDISPHNILLSWEGDVKVTDFGIAKAAHTLTRDEQQSATEAIRATGKLAFMSPEQSRSEPTDPRSDLFSLGTTAYQMLTGANPFAAPTAGETLRRLAAGEHPPIHLTRQGVPRALTEIVEHLLQPEPNKRFTRAADLSQELLELAYTEGVRYGAADLAALLAPLREPAEPGELEPASVLDAPTTSTDRTPVEIPRAASPLPPPPSLPEAGDRREVTVLVVCFGGAPTSRAPDALLTRVRDILDRHGAWIEEHSASQVVAIFGLGETDGRDADAALRASLVVVRERSEGIKPAAGVQSGAILVDDGGIPIRDSRLVSLVGDAQTLARATEDQVSVSPITARLVRRSFVTEPLPEPARALCGGGLVVRRQLAAMAQRGRFVGRRAELKRLGAILGSATRRRPQLVLLHGETGLGKSRLLLEARRRLDKGDFNVAFYSTSCPLNGASIPYSGMRAMLQVLCGVQHDDDPHRIAEVAPRLRALGLRDEHASAVLDALGARTAGKGEGSRSALRAAFGRMVTSLCRDKLHCFAWDDAQAIDRETLEGLLHLCGPHNRLRAVFILAQRGDVPPALTKRKNVHRMRLGPLDASDTAKLVESLLGARTVPDGLMTYVRSCAGGHPLFIDELLRELGDSGYVQVLNGTVTLQAQTPPTAPRTLRTLIGDRVSRLRQRERGVLKALAVLGEPTTAGMLATLLGLSLPALDRLMGSLENNGLVRRTGPTEVRFASPLYAEIVNDLIPPGAARELHAKAAKTYTDAATAGLGESDERIAHHLELAGDRRGAVDHHWSAAREKLGRGRVEEALRNMLQGLELASAADRDVEQLGDWLRDIATTVSQVRKARGLKASLSRAVREIATRGEPEQHAAAQIEMARALGSVNLFEDAYQALEQAASVAAAHPTLMRQSLMAEMQIASRQGLFVRAVKACDQLEAMGPIDDPQAICTLALARSMEGQCEAALALMDRLDSDTPAVDDLDTVMRRKHRAIIYFNARDWEAAAQEAKELSALARHAGLRFDTAAALHNLGDSRDRLGDHPRAYAAFVESLELTQALEHDRLTNLNRMHLCLLDGLRSAEGCEEKLQALIRHADTRGYLWDVLEGRFLLARLAVAVGQHDKATSALEQVYDAAKKNGHQLIEIDARELLGELKGEAPADPST